MGQIQGVPGRIKERLHALGYWKHDRPDVRRFCEEHGYTTQYLYGWLQGRTPSFAYVTRLAGDLGVTVEWLALGDGAGLEEAAAPRRGRPAGSGSGSVGTEPAKEPPGNRPIEADQARGGRGKIIEHPLARIGVLMERLSKSESELQSTVRAWRDSEERFRKIFEDGPLGMAVFDPNTLFFLGVNRRFVEMLGYLPGEVVGRHVLSFSHPDDTAPGMASLTKILAGDAPFVTRESRYVRKSGDILWGHVTTIIIRSDASAVLYGVKMIQDVTERRCAEERLQSLFDRVPVGLYRATPDGQLLDANPAYVQILGYPTRESLLATNAEALYVDVNDRRRWRDTLERDGIARDFEKELRRPDGTIIWVRDSARAVRDPTGRTVAWEGAVEDVTARKRAEDTTRALALIDRELAGTLDLARTTERIVTAVLDLLHASRSVLFRLDRAAGSMTCVAAAGAGSPAAWIGRSLPADAGLAGLSIRDGEPRWSPDLLADPRLTIPDWVRERLQIEAYDSGLGVPLTAGGEVLGALFIGNVRGRNYTEEDLRLVSALADQAALALRNARLYEEARQGRREAEVLADLAGTINASLDLDTVLQQIVDGARELCGSDLARIALRRPPSNDMVITHGSGARYDRYDAVRVEPGKGLGGQVLATGRPFRTDNYCEDPRFSKDYVAVAEAEGTIAEIAVPILAGSGIDGLLYVTNRCHRPFTDRDEAILLRLADHAAVAIRNARLFEEAERRRKAAECLADVNRLAAESPELTEVGQRIVDGLLSLLGVKAATLYRPEPGSGKLVALAVAGGLGGISWSLALVPGNGVVGLAAQDGMPVFTEDPLTDPRITYTPEQRALIETRPYRAVLALPLTVRGTVIGALGVGDRPGRTFSQEEIHLAEAFADQAALALENARLLAEVKAQRDRLRGVGAGTPGVRAEAQKARSSS